MEVTSPFLVQKEKESIVLFYAKLLINIVYDFFIVTFVQFFWIYMQLKNQNDERILFFFFLQWRKQLQKDMEEEEKARQWQLQVKQKEEEEHQKQLVEGKARKFNKNDQDGDETKDITENLVKQGGKVTQSVAWITHQSVLDKDGGLEGWS